MNSRKFVNVLAYVALALVAIALVAKYLTMKVFNLNSNVGAWCDRIAYYLTMIVTIFSAFAYARSRRNAMYMTGFAVFVIVIIVFMFVL